MSDPFVEQHKKEIERMAFKIFQLKDYCHFPNTPEGNFLQAIDIVKRTYKEKEAHSVESGANRIYPQ